MLQHVPPMSSVLEGTADECDKATRQACVEVRDVLVATIAKLLDPPDGFNDILEDEVDGRVVNSLDALAGAGAACQQLHNAALWSDPFIYLPDVAAKLERVAESAHVLANIDTECVTVVQAVVGHVEAHRSFWERMHTGTDETFDHAQQSRNLVEWCRQHSWTMAVGAPTTYTNKSDTLAPGGSARHGIPNAALETRHTQHLNMCVGRLDIMGGKVGRAAAMMSLRRQLLGTLL